MQTQYRKNALFATKIVQLFSEHGNLQKEFHVNFCTMTQIKFVVKLTTVNRKLIAYKMEEKIKEINDLNNQLKRLQNLENLLKTKQGKPLIGFRKSFFIAIEIEDWEYHEVEMPSSIRENILENLKILIDTIENQLNNLLK